jgi:hypothetical protein
LLAHQKKELPVADIANHEEDLLLHISQKIFQAANPDA